jgi:phosphomannomutase
VLNACGGIIITSSHNPVEWNGLKFVDTDGLFVGAENVKSIYELAEKGPRFQILEDKSLHGKVTPVLLMFICLIISCLVFQCNAGSYRISMYIIIHKCG